MSRVTPVARVAQTSRTVSSYGNIAGQKNSFRNTSMAIYRGLKDTKVDRMTNKDVTSLSYIFRDHLPNIELKGSQATQGLHTVHRPTVSSPYKIVPMMQVFRNSAPKNAFHGLSTIDSHLMPSLKSPPPPPAKLRVPLLPDNYKPDRSLKTGHSLEISDDAVLKPEISIVAHHFEYGAPVPIGESSSQ
ncbi:hypothetical protein HI914_03443 [Erysiphe necator]|nr:hypothetical protein HI914_03443 [Erysiphe necator]